VDRYVEKVQYSFLDYISSGFELNFMVAVDFTGDSPSSTSYISYLYLETLIIKIDGLSFSFKWRSPNSKFFALH